MSEPDSKARMRAIIERVRNRKRYTHLNREIIASIADADLILAIQDLLQDHVLVGGAVAAWDAFERLAPGPRALFAIDQLDSQVRNGGFAQFFWNMSGRYAPFAFEGLGLVGALQRKAIVQQAMDLFLAGGGPAQRRIGRHDAVAGFEAFRGTIDFRALDSSYYRLDEVEPLRALQVAYVRAHVDEFVLPGAEHVR
jgi:hypothetical protein